VKKAFLLVLALAVASQAEDWVQHYKDRVAAFEKENEKLDPGTRYVVLVGDSLTEGWTPARVKRFLPNVGARTLNRGIVSDGIGVNERGVLNRLDASVLHCHPGHVFLLAGVNDVGKKGEGIDRAAAAYEKVVKAVRAGAKDAELVLVMLSPTAKKYAGMNDAIARFNARIAGIAAETSTTVIDLHAKLVDKTGALPETMTTDGLHWTDPVYEILGAEIERVVTTPRKKTRK
jgi:lysophospholipase L1-like esterase